MSNLEKYKKVFMEALEISEEECISASSKTNERWDSVGQMMIITELEEIFGIEIEPNDMMEFNSYEMGMKILNKYGIEF